MRATKYAALALLLILSLTFLLHGTLPQVSRTRRREFHRA